MLDKSLLAEELGFDAKWERNAESYELFRMIWRNEKVTAKPRFRPSLDAAKVWPRPLQQPVRVWHGSATAEGIS